MTRLAIVGSSHTGAVRQSDGLIRANHPGVETSYFALPGAPYRRAMRDADGIFRARPADDAEADMIRRVNGAIEIDLAPFDHIWVIGNRYGMGRILTLLMHHDVLELSRTGARATISLGFFRAALRAEIDASTSRIAAQFGADTRLTFSPAPYPAQKARAQGKFHEPPLAHILGHPDRDLIFADYHDGIRDSLTRHGYGFLPQPAATLAAPFATRTQYLRDARDFRDTSVAMADLRHMNADFGYRFFLAYAELHPGLGSSIPCPQTDKKEC